MELRQIVALNLRRMRRVKGVSQEGLAWDAKVDRRYMAKIETGQTSTGLDIIERLATALGCEPYELLLPPPRRGRRSG